MNRVLITLRVSQAIIDKGGMLNVVMHNATDANGWNVEEIDIMSHMERSQVKASIDKDIKSYCILNSISVIAESRELFKFSEMQSVTSYRVLSVWREGRGACGRGTADGSVSPNFVFVLLENACKLLMCRKMCLFQMLENARLST